MTPDVLARVFQPFFTTKPVGAGTGLGLAVVHGIVVQSGGAIDVDTEVGRGTLWEIFLPETRSVSASRIPAVAGPASAGRVILVVEDDEALRRLARRILTSRGHTVRVARNGAEALEILDRDGEAIDLVVTDVVMPEMDGRELGDRLARVAPRLKILYVSGYTDDMLVRRGLSREEVDFLHKPYTVASLGAAVDRVLASQPGTTQPLRR